MKKGDVFRRGLGRRVESLYSLFCLLPSNRSPEEQAEG